jgi:hypothetical protein
MTSEATARVLGAILVAGLFAQLTNPLPDNGLGLVQLLLLTIACPTIALIFSLPTRSHSLYFYITLGLMAALTAAVVVGIDQVSRDESADEVAFLTGFAFGLVPSLLGLALGSGAARSLAITER